MSAGADAATMAGAARAASLLLVSLHAVGVASVAWRVDDAGGLVGRALLMAAALAVSGQLPRATTPAGSGERLERARLLGTLAYGMLFVAGLSLGLGAGAERMPRIVSAYASLQPLLLLTAELARSQTVVLANALLLVVFTVLGGGAPVAIAVAGHVALVPFVLAFDHVTRTLAAWPSAPASVVGRVARDAARLSVPVAAVTLAVLLALAPETAHVRDLVAGRDAGDPARLEAAWRRLVLLGVLGVALVVPLVRLFRAGGRPRPAPPPEAIEAGGAVDEALPEEPASGPILDRSAAGRVMAAYLRVLQAARRAGYRRRSSGTPAAIAGELAPRSAELHDLTAAFMDARYGADPIDDGRAARSEAQAEVLERLLRARAVARRRRR